MLFIASEELATAERGEHSNPLRKFNKGKSDTFAGHQRSFLSSEFSCLCVYNEYRTKKWESQN